MTFGQLLVSFLELNIFFTYLGIIELPIRGLYGIVLTLTVDKTPDPSDMSHILDFQDQSMFYYLNCLKKGYYFASQTSIGIYALIVCFYFINRLVLILLSKILTYFLLLTPQIKHVIDRIEDYS